MLKKVYISSMGAMLISSVGLAAPITEFKEGQSTLGYYYFTPDDHVDMGGTSVDFDAEDHGVYLQTALSDRLLLGVEYVSGRAHKTVAGNEIRLSAKPTDLALQVKINSNIHLIAGNRSYNHGMRVNDGPTAKYEEDKFTYGVAFRAELAERWNGYAIYKRNNVATDFNIGVNYALSKDSYLDINYASNKLEDLDNGVPKMRTKGFGIGMGYKF